MTVYFQESAIEHPRLTAEFLLAHVLGTTRLKLYIDIDRPASPCERATLRGLVKRAAAHEPVDYLVGQSPFYCLELKVNASVLIPRPSTETIVEQVIARARRTDTAGPTLVADIGTGCGAIAIAVAKHLAGCRISATDISAAALEVAADNARTQGVADRISFRQGNLLEPLAGQRVNYLLSNPPYISDDQWPKVPAHIRCHEPALALRAGPDGLKYLRPLIAQARACLDRSGLLVLEIADTQSQIVVEMASRSAGLGHVRVLPDHEGLPRVLLAEAV